VYTEITYRDLRADRLVQGFVVTLRDVTKAHDPVEQVPHLDHVEELPAWVEPPERPAQVPLLTPLPHRKRSAGPVGSGASRS